MIYFTSDLHLNHDREFIYQPRGFASVQEMNETIIRNWNNTVTDDDEVYVVGDLMLGGKDPRPSLELLKQLKGKLHIVRGNHDTDNRAESYLQLPNVLSVSVGEILRYGDYHFVIFHYPAETGPLKKGELTRISICLCGHTHSKEKFYNDLPYIYNVACDAHNCTPVSIEEIIHDCVTKVEMLRETSTSEDIG